MICANCGAERSGPFCGRCGQNDRDYQRALPPLLGELLRETFEVDSRLLRTLRMLLLQPGQLALEFSRNRRARYVSPIRLYLFVSILFFFLLSLSTNIETVPGAEADTVARVEGESTGPAAADVAADVDTLLAQLDALRVARARDILARPQSSVARAAFLELARSARAEPSAPDSVRGYLTRQLIDVLYEPRMAVDRLLDNLPSAIFTMVPVYALLLKLFYFGKHRYYVENLVFATHLHTYLFIVFTVLLLLPEQTGREVMDTISSWLAVLLVLGVGIYHYLALRRYFGQGRLVTAVKFSGIMIIYLSLLMPTALLLLLFTLATL